MAAPGQLPRLGQRISEILRHARPELEDERPEHRDRQQERPPADEYRQLAALSPRRGRYRGRGPHPAHGNAARAWFGRRGDISPAGDAGGWTLSLRVSWGLRARGNTSGGSDAEHHPPARHPRDGPRPAADRPGGRLAGRQRRDGDRQGPILRLRQRHRRGVRPHARPHLPFTGTGHVRVGKGKQDQAFFGHSNVSFTDTFTNPANGCSYTEPGRLTFQETRAVRVSGSIFQFTSVNAGTVPLERPNGGDGSRRPREHPHDDPVRHPGRQHA